MAREYKGIELRMVTVDANLKLFRSYDMQLVMLQP